ncbi:MAG: hypothetical protein C0467_01425 [Planctomycetaceae bacterium]|nr:hypothetical protein [Planctomycetaceae bacterium]
MHFTDEQPFLDAIFARYHDDGPRLMYADFLDDSEEPERAELVRVQLALARLRDDHPRRAELAERQAELLTAHSAQWSEHLGHLVAGVEFRRGVLDSVSMNAETFISAGDELFRLCHVRRLRLLDASRIMEKLTASPLLSSVRELDLCGNELGNGGTNLLVRSPYLKHLDSLDLGFNGLDDSGVNALARASTLVNLTSLSLNDNTQITSAGIISLSESPFFAALTTLDLAGNDIDDAGVRALVAGKMLPRLHTLRLRGNPIDDGGAVSLVGSTLLARMLSRLPHLELRVNAIGADGAVALARSPVLARCQYLDMTGNSIGDHGFAAIVASPHLSNLHTLKLASNQITDAGLSAVREKLPKLLGHLRVFDLGGNRLTRHGLALLHGARGESGVVLDVSNNVQSVAGGEVPVSVADVVPGVLQGVSEAAELRRRISNPRSLPNS